MASRLLIIRFSSFGDIIQCVGVPRAFRDRYADASVDWLVRADFSGLLEGHPEINTVYPFDRRNGVIALLKLAWKLAGRESGPSYSHLYDAHNNLRSRLFCWAFRLRAPQTQFARRPKDRLRRWLLFRWRLPALPMPFRGANSFHRPLKRWGLAESVPSGRHYYAKEALPNEVETWCAELARPMVALAPSAAWEMKRWPIEHWKTLIGLLPDINFALLGGPTDDFIKEIEAVAPDRARNWAGRLSLAQNAGLFEKAAAVVANDTGLLHVADQMERPTIALIGPSAFGYPSHSSSSTMEVDLYCKPCSKDGRGKCVNSLYKRCLIEVTPESVANEIRRVLKGTRR